ncbi:MAG TPA: hypothetical protein VMM76_00530, partial [Pirellulaceae bacterium]|nr:hypothetical protein [Pirellulaceae bacterium]
SDLFNPNAARSGFPLFGDASYVTANNSCKCETSANNGGGVQLAGKLTSSQQACNSANDLARKIPASFGDTSQNRRTVSCGIAVIYTAGGARERMPKWRSAG